VRPDGCLIRFGRGSGVQVVGAMTVERRFDLPGGSRTFGIRFRPGMAVPFLGIAAAELTDRIVALEDLWGSAAARRMEARIAGSLPVLSSVLPAPAGAPDRVHLALEAIAAAHGNIDLDWVARHAGMGARQFRRRCLEESGLTPKHLCRVLRFRRACALAHPVADWAEIAASAGYFDQSHLIRYFREFTGSTPVSVFSNTRAASVRYIGEV
jgi:AraC-like DNA-binding protein